MRRLAIIALGCFSSAAAGQSQPALPRIVPDRECAAPDPQHDDIVVCGRSSEDSPYRIPRELRDVGPIQDRNMSWSARVRDQQSIERYSGQNIGPSGLLQHSRRMDCEWRVARQLAQGRQPDCTRRVQPNEPTDWQRR